MSAEFVNWLYSVSVLLLFIVACIFSFKRRMRGQPEGIFLSLMYWSFFLSMLMGNFTGTELGNEYPHLIRLAQVFMLAYMPLSYLYIRQTLRPSPFSWRDLLHFLPVVIYIIDYLPFFLSSAEEKRQVNEALMNSGKLYTFNEGLFAPAGFHVALRFAVFTGYWIAGYLVLRRSIREKGNDLTVEQALLVRWMKWLVYSQLFIFAPPILNIIFAFGNITLVNGFFGTVAALVQGYFLLFRPEILYGWGGYEQSRAFEQDLQAELKHDLASEALDAGGVEKVPVTVDQYLPGLPSQFPDPQKLEWIRTTASVLEKYFRDNKPYLRQGYTLPDLAQEMGYTTNQLSFLINHHYGIHFNALINRYRVEACKTKLVNEEFRQKTLEAIAHEVGFYSRATFINAFKTETGKTPSAFIRELTPA
jgi:AraC-like DNA-binding protein